jgi:hypothetical protein
VPGCGEVQRRRGAATSRLSGLQEKVRRLGVDPDGVRDGPYRFREVVCRDEGGRRFDVPVPWMPGGGEAGTPLSEGQAGAIERFHFMALKTHVETSQRRMHITITSTVLTNKKKA